MSHRITRNAVRCKGCDTIIESTYRHDYRTCGCPNGTMVDGGLAYNRWGGVDPSLIKNLSTYVCRACGCIPPDAEQPRCDICGHTGCNGCIRDGLCQLCHDIEQERWT